MPVSLLQCSAMMTHRCLGYALDAVSYLALQTEDIAFHHNDIRLALGGKHYLACQPRR